MKKIESLPYLTQTKDSLPATIIGESPAIKSLFALVRTVACAHANVLITGESGTGKELVARSLHNLSERKHKPFIPVNCAAIPEHLLESELFGHAKGSFTGALGEKKGLFEEAEGGTFFLDEIGDMNLQLQAKLLRVLQYRKVRPVGSNHYKDINIRIVAATHRNIKNMADSGQFREDLFYRLNVIPLRMPPLRERIEDIPLLIAAFIRKFNHLNNTHVKGLTQEAMEVLLSYYWPGNIRELENTIERAIVLNKGNLIEKKIILEMMLKESNNDAACLYADRPTLAQLEERYVKMILKESGHRKEVASRILGISRRTLHRRELDYKIIDHHIKDHEPTDQLDFLSEDKVAL